MTRLYLRIEPKYAMKLSDVWLLSEVPSDVRDHLRLPLLDEGIDLVAKTNDDAYWAIQCKYRSDESKSLTRRDLSTCTDLAFGVCKNFDHALVCTSADRFSRKLKLHEGRLSYCAGDVWRSLGLDFFDAARSFLDGEEFLPTRYEPRPHQTRAIDNAVEHFVGEGNARGKLIMPCGTGKSLTGYWIADALEANRILVAVPSLALIRQTLSVWSREALASNKTFNWICVCSDQSVKESSTEDSGVLVQDLGVRVHTDPGEIAAWLSNAYGPTVVFSTYQSSRAISEAARSASMAFDLGIMDEAHKTVGKRDSLFSHLLDDDNLAIHRRVFMTATERRYQGRSEQISSMDDPEVYGDTFELLSFKEALEADPPILSDYKIITMCVSDDEVAKLVEQNVFVKPDRGKWDKEVEADMLASVVAFRKAMKEYPIRHAVSFHSSIARASAFRTTNDRFTDTYTDYGSLQTFHVSGRTPTAARAREMDLFAEADHALVTNARCLTEGVDVPDIDCILFADPKRSTVDIVQAVGRALRKADEKEFGYVILPVLLEEGAEDIDVSADSAFGTVLITLRALAANDERIIEYFRGISHGRRLSRGSGPVDFVVPEHVRIDTSAFVDAIEHQVWSKLARLSWRPFGEARTFVRSLGLESHGEWRRFCNGETLDRGILPKDIPKSPDRLYEGQGWSGWGDWLGTGTIAPYLREYRPFKEARAFARTLGLGSVAEWTRFCKGEIPEKGSLPPDIPASPARTYRGHGWGGMIDWLGTQRTVPRRGPFLPFPEARKFARSLNLASSTEWGKFCAGELSGKGTLPENIPTNPHHVYGKSGWSGMIDWLGTDRPRPRRGPYRSFGQARLFARTLGLSSMRAWKQYTEDLIDGLPPLPADVPRYPQISYRNSGWTSWPDWLSSGTPERRRGDWLPINKAKHFSRSLALTTGNDWKRYIQGLLPDLPPLPGGVPRYPQRAYRDAGWISWQDWLGPSYSVKRGPWLPFPEARRFVQGLELTSHKDWLQYKKSKIKGIPSLPDDIPGSPDSVYKNSGWVSWSDWLGVDTAMRADSRFKDFGVAREYARRLGLKSSGEWRKFAKGDLLDVGLRPADIPANPRKIYGESGWAGWPDWLGYEVVSWRSFGKAREFVRGLGLRTHREWRDYVQAEVPGLGPKPEDIPSAANLVYGDSGWVSWGDWLGTDSVHPGNVTWRSFEGARDFARSLKLDNGTQWRALCKGQLPEKGELPADIPAYPGNVYMDKGWKGMADWLYPGGVRSSRFRPFGEARTFVQDLGLRTDREWALYVKKGMPGLPAKPTDIPRSPHTVYRHSGWISWPDWLGTVNKDK
ncbi:DEAD/DEAH box helicase family protein [Bacteroidota bacterium]